MEGELGAFFPYKLEASHVLPKRQLYVEACAEVGAVVYKNYSGHNEGPFLDRLCGVLERRLAVVPHGSLCFFASYRLQNTQVSPAQNAP
jgi:hypothetical protein